MRTRLIALAVTGATLLASVGVAGAAVRPVAAPASFGIQLLSTAAETLKNPLARTYIADGLAPGTSLIRTVEISNTTRSTAVVSVYPAAATLDNNSFAFAPGRSQDELSRSTTVSQGVLRVPPNEDALDTVTIKIPTQASAGEEYGVVWAQMSAPDNVRGGVTFVNRVGIRMYVSVGDGGLPTAHFLIASLSGQRAANGRPFVRASIHNNGQRTLMISGSLTLDNGPGGLRAGPFPVKLAAALTPGESEPLTVALNKILPRGPWKAQIRLASGPLQRSAEATISFPRQGIAPVRTSSATRHR